VEGKKRNLQKEEEGGEKNEVHVVVVVVVVLDWKVRGVVRRGRRDDGCWLCVAVCRCEQDRGWGLRNNLGGTLKAACDGPKFPSEDDMGVVGMDVDMYIVVVVVADGVDSDVGVAVSSGAPALRRKKTTTTRTTTSSVYQTA
jgi:hypothetical protein